MTKDEALKLARTALGVQLDALLGKAGHLRNDDRKRYAENGIKAIDQALANDTSQERVDETSESVHEPVAWISTTELLVMRGNAHGGAKDWRVNLGLEPEEGDVGLYTTPPQRTWVHLTNEEHTELAIEWGCLSADWVFYAAAVERKIKEKNT